jgi:hypothetical protein
VVRNRLQNFTMQVLRKHHRTFRRTARAHPALLKVYPPRKLHALLGIGKGGISRPIAAAVLAHPKID